MHMFIYLGCCIISKVIKKNEMNTLDYDDVCKSGIIGVTQFRLYLIAKIISRKKPISQFQPEPPPQLNTVQYIRQAI